MEARATRREPENTKFLLSSSRAATSRSSTITQLESSSAAGPRTDAQMLGENIEVMPAPGTAQIDALVMKTGVSEESTRVPTSVMTEVSSAATTTVSSAVSSSFEETRNGVNTLIRRHRLRRRANNALLSGGATAPGAGASNFARP
ncbi:unnamed protein product [Amoebophrya sp. A25]|nr:unnamed protein product [Amoebophrya sp. A25]|eukprot:GSA25T00018984001.1